MNAVDDLPSELRALADTIRSPGPGPAPDFDDSVIAMLAEAADELVRARHRVVLRGSALTRLLTDAAARIRLTGLDLDEAAACEQAAAALEWQPFGTVPHDRFVELRSDSGGDEFVYSVYIARWSWGAWVTSDGEHAEEFYPEPTHWREAS